MKIIYPQAFVAAQRWAETALLHAVYARREMAWTKAMLKLKQAYGIKS